MNVRSSIVNVAAWMLLGTSTVLGASTPSVPTGFHDASDCSVTAGWACDPDDFNASLAVNVYLDGPAGSGTILGAATADQSRSDLAAPCGGNPNHAFGFPTPDWIKDGQPHTLYTYAINIDPAGVNPLLGTSPKTITCSRPAGTLPNFNVIVQQKPHQVVQGVTVILTTPDGQQSVQKTDVYGRVTFASMPAGKSTVYVFYKGNHYNGSVLFGSADFTQYVIFDSAGMLSDDEWNQIISSGSAALLAQLNSALPSVLSVKKSVNGDYDADGKTDISVWRPSDGTWYIKDKFTIPWGTAGDIPVPGDYNGDGKTDIAVWRPSEGNWYIKDQFTSQWGTAGDIPVPGDYDGDGKTDIAVWRPSEANWYFKDKATIQWGLPGDIPVPGDYDGDGKTDIAVWRPSEANWYFKDKATIQWGLPGDIPVPGDYDGDGKTDIAVWRPSNGTWYIKGQATIAWGTVGDIPVPGDYNGDGKTDIAVWRPSDGNWYIKDQSTTLWGTQGDIPVVNSVITAMQASGLMSVSAPSAPSKDTVWVEDALPAGAIPAGDGEGWTWIADPHFSGNVAHASNNAGGVHQHYFTGATQQLNVNPGDTLFAYVYLDPINPPSEVMLQWNDGSWEHRAYWGDNQLGFGVDGSVSRMSMGPLSGLTPGTWVKLAVPASVVGLEGRTLNGMAFTLFNGKATWDYAGVTSNSLNSLTNVTPIKASQNVAGIRIYPNPWQAKKTTTSGITFDQFNTHTTVKIFTVSGHWVKTLPVSSTSAVWDLTNSQGDKVASGLYLYVITTDTGEKKTGQIGVIR